MYFVRFFKSGGADYDARQRTNAEYKCVSCSHVHWEPGVNPAYLNIQNEKKCPKCGCLNLEDKKRNLIFKKASLVTQKNEIDKELARVAAEIENLKEA